MTLESGWARILPVLCSIVTSLCFVCITTGFRIAWALADSNRSSAWFEAHWNWWAMLVGGVGGVTLAYGIRIAGSSVSLHRGSVLGISAIVPTAVLAMAPGQVPICV